MGATGSGCWILAGLTLGLLIWVSPARAESPCDSEAVVPDVQETLLSDCVTLWEFLTNLDDPGVLDDPDNPQAWLSTTPFVRWQGISTGGSGVEAVYLPDAGLTGSISPGLGGLSGLVVLDLGRNQLTGPIPATITKLPNLKYLSLHTNQLTGSIPEQIGELTQLEILDLGGNQLTGPIPATITKLPNLKYLSLHTNQLTGSIPEQIGELTQLEILDLGGNQLTGPMPAAITKLPNLKYLSLHTNQLTGSIPEQIGELTELEILELGMNRLTGPVPFALANLTKLRYLSLHSNQLTGSRIAGLSNLAELEVLNIEGNDLTNAGSIDPFLSDPLQLVMYADIHRFYSLVDQVWNVWTCDTPSGEVAIEPSRLVDRLNREITRYFEWISGGRYRPTFRLAGAVSGDDGSRCRTAILGEGSDRPVLVVDDTTAIDGSAGLGVVTVGGGAVSGAPPRGEPRLSTVAHWIGHSLGFPRSFGGNIRWSRRAETRGVYEHDNPMDIMSGPLDPDLRTGTIAINRYAAGWISPDEVIVHGAGTVADYTLRPPGAGGVQMLVLPGERPGMFTTLGARVAIGYDAAIPKQGVEVYRIDQRERACARPAGGACWGTARRTRPFPPAETGTTHGDDLDRRGRARLVKHVHLPGATFEVGAATVEVLKRVGNSFVVRVTDTSAPPPQPEPSPSPEPSYAGRFSDDDGNVHEESIETIAELGITVGCNPPDNDRYCPAGVVTRVQMMAFLARALGEEGDPAVTTSRFSDVPDDARYLGYVERLADLGVVEPDEDGTFRPYEPLTRLDMAAFLARAFPAISQVAEPVGVFVDVPADAEGVGAVEGILAAGVTKGCRAEPLSYCPGRAVQRDQMASFLARALRARPPVLQPGEGVSIRMARANWSTGYFQAALYRALLQELGYEVTDPAGLELSPGIAYPAMAERDFDLWANGWYPNHDRFLDQQLPDGSSVRDHVIAIGDQMPAGGVQGFLVTKSFADEYEIETLDDLNRNSAALAAYDRADAKPGDGAADIYGCPPAWACAEVFDGMIALANWNNIRQVRDDYNPLRDRMVTKVLESEPAIAYVWGPSHYLDALDPGRHTVWLGVDQVLDDSNPLGFPGGEDWDQRPGTAPIAPHRCPDAATRGTCQLGWPAADIRVTANAVFLRANPAAARLLQLVELDPIDVSRQIAQQNQGTDLADLVTVWIAQHRNQVDVWLARARAGA